MDSNGLLKYFLAMKNILKKKKILAERLLKWFFGCVSNYFSLQEFIVTTSILQNNQSLLALCTEPIMKPPTARSWVLAVSNCFNSWFLGHIKILP